MKKSKKEWKTCLTPEQFRVLREKGTETPFSGKLLKEKRKGRFVCAACGQVLFDSKTKFESGTGWPSFSDVAEKGRIKLKEEPDGRTEVTCSKCGSHLGHVFDDGPAPTWKRYCINSAALEFKKQTISSRKK